MHWTVLLAWYWARAPVWCVVPMLMHEHWVEVLVHPCGQCPTSSASDAGAQVLNSDQTAFVHIGKSRYAHAAQEGVVHVPHARRKAASSGDTSQAAAASQPDGAPAMAPRPTQPPLQLGGMLSSQAPPMPAPSAAPHIQLGVPVEPPPAGHLSSSFGSLQRIGPGAVAAAVQGPHASVAENMPINAAPIRQ